MKLIVPMFRAIPLKTKGEVREFCTEFPRTAKKVVSHIELQAWLSSVGFTMYGPHIRMRKIHELDFPSPLLQGQRADLRIKLLSERRISGRNMWFVKVDVRAFSVERRLPLMIGQVTIVAGETEAEA